MSDETRNRDQEERDEDLRRDEDRYADEGGADFTRREERYLASTRVAVEGLGVLNGDEETERDVRDESGLLYRRKSERDSILGSYSNEDVRNSENPPLESHEDGDSERNEYDVRSEGQESLASEENDPSHDRDESSEEVEASEEDRRLTEEGEFEVSDSELNPEFSENYQQDQENLREEAQKRDDTDEDGLQKTDGEQ